MNAKRIILLLALLLGVAADSPRGRFSNDDMLAIMKAVQDYRPTDYTAAHFGTGLTPDTAMVRLCRQVDGRIVTTAVLTLKKTPKGWMVDSCAR